MFEKWKGFKPVGDEVIKHQFASGDAVPTIQEALKNKDSLPFLVAEVRRMMEENPEDAKKFDAGLVAAEELLTKDNITFGEVKGILEIAGASFGAAFFGTLVAYLAGGVEMATTVGAIGGMYAKLTTGMKVMSAPVSGVLDARDRNSMLERVRVLRNLTTPARA